jgi:hypothetical protein
MATPVHPVSLVGVASGSGRRVSSQETGGTVAGVGREEGGSRRGKGGGGGGSLHETASEKRKEASQLLRPA